MSQGSLKDVSFAISKAGPDLSLPLPNSLLEVISAYLEKHSTNDDSELKNLQDELLAVFQNTIVKFPSSLAAFLAIVQKLKLEFRNSMSLIQWWDRILDPIFMHLGVEPGLANATRDFLLSILLHNEHESEGEQLEYFESYSAVMAEILIAKWLSKTKQADEELDGHAGFVAGHIQSILFEYGKKSPKNFLIKLNKFFVRTESRILSLSLLSNFFRNPPPHLHQMLLTPLFVNILKCLQFDSSTRAVSLATTVLIMFLPHIPSIISKNLPALFNIYTRMLFWDRVKMAEEISSSRVNCVKTDTYEKDWTKLYSPLDSDDESCPEILHYFTFLYGLYPLNFMSYIRKPLEYLSCTNFVGADLHIQPIEVRQRSERFRQVHLLHPNFFTLTVESEISDDSRWIKSDTADVVAECMALYAPSESSHEEITLPKDLKTRSDYLKKTLDKESISNTDFRHAPVSSQAYDSLSQGRQFSHSSFPILSSRESPFLKVSEKSNGSAMTPQSSRPFFTSRRSGSVLYSTSSPHKAGFESLKNDSNTLPHSSDNHESHADSNLISPIGYDISRPSFFNSISSRSLPLDMRLAYLYREIQLLRNHLNFEQYLKKQHLSYIGQLRRKHIRETRIETEKQNVIISNRDLKQKLEEAKRLNIQLKKESEKSKNHCRKWESELSAKLRALREEQKRWFIERASMVQELETTKKNQAVMRQIILKLEANELKEKQRSIHVESTVEELERLRAEVEELNLRVKIFEVNEQAAKVAKDNEIAAEARSIMLEAELKSRDQELVDVKTAFQKEISDIQRQALNANLAPDVGKKAMQNMIDSALAISRTRITELQKSYNHLLVRYQLLQEQQYGFHDEKNELSMYEEVDSESEVDSCKLQLNPNLKQEKQKDIEDVSGSTNDRDR
ncbi:Tuberous sclerosis 1 protein-like protein [Golovinomyces cichoracearum]|uniref:Tuberous sclerosis 1 protein-like protein n=1 Tax=Golovinomyces cichoracearum TaxID=62708 RepID=A0A420I8B0_9PEZI|nr:Tuberous sclerosis 1 protein-like protein [Golovinomyces cichoracearum]